MGIERLEHYTINTTDVAGVAQFYVDAVGLRVGDRPNFDFPGAWLYCGDIPVVHLIGVEREPAHANGTLDHVAFRATDRGRFQKRLAERGIPFRERQVPGQPLYQMFLEDPGGITIELNFWEG